MEEKKQGKKRIMLISPMLHQGGFERVCVTTARILESYFDVVILIFDSADIAYDVDGLSVIDIQMGVQNGRIRKLLNVVRRSLKVRRLKKELRPDIVYSFGSSANLVNAISKTGREKVWLGLRGYTDLEDVQKIKLFRRLADLCICCSKDIEEELKNKFRFNKTAVLYNPFRVEAICREAKAAEPDIPFENRKKKESGSEGFRYLVSMGRDDEIKGFYHLLKIFSLVHERIPESRLFILGDGSFEKDKRLAKELKIDKLVFFAGMQKNPYPYVEKGEIYLLTSLHEGFPNALVEGMALSLAPVCTNCMTGPAEILLQDGNTAAADRAFLQKENASEKSVLYGDYGILLPVMKEERDDTLDRITGTERLFADTIVELMNDESRLRFYREAARRRACDFTYEAYAEQFLLLAEKAGVGYTV